MREADITSAKVNLLFLQQLNEHGIMFANYVRSVKENKTVNNPVEMVVIEEVKDVDAKKQNDCDVIV